MFNLIGLTQSDAKKELEQKHLPYSFIRYNSRFKEDVSTDSLRVIRQTEKTDGTIELVVSDFKTIPQSR